MIVDGRNSTKVAIYLVLFGLLVLFAGYFISVHEQQSLTGYWAGIGVVTVLLTLLFSHSYTVGKRKLTAKEKQNARKTAASARLGWLWGGIGIGSFFILKRVFHWDPDPPLALISGFGAACLLMGIAVLLDNVWLRAVFLWNNSDPQIRKLWSGK